PPAHAVVRGRGALWTRRARGSPAPRRVRGHVPTRWHPADILTSVPALSYMAPPLPAGTVLVAGLGGRDKLRQAEVEVPGLPETGRNATRGPAAPGWWCMRRGSGGRTRRAAH